MTIYYDSKTGNVQRFVNKIRACTNWECIKISDDVSVSQYGHLITYTTQMGSVPESTLRFMEQHSAYIESVSSSGNKNWGIYYAKAANLIADQYKIPVILKFELAGLNSDVNMFIKKIQQHADKEVDIAQQ